MKKFALLLLLLPTFIMVVSGAANAQRKNTTSHNVMQKIEDKIAEKKDDKMYKNEKNCKCDCKHHKKHKKKHKNKHHKDSDK